MSAAAGDDAMAEERGSGCPGAYRSRDVRRSLKSLVPPSRRMAGGVCVGGMVLALLAGMAPCKVQAVPFGQQARRPKGSPAAGFRFTDLRVQASARKGAPALSRMRGGGKFYIVVRFGFGRPRRGLGRPQSRTNVACSYTMSSARGTRIQDTKSVSVPFATRTAAYAFPPITFHLREDVSETTFVIQAAVTANGASQTRTTRFSVYR
jgi:hypothetical protein